MRNDLEQLVETANRLANTLSLIAKTELRDSWDLGYQLQGLSSDTKKIANSLRDIRTGFIGVEV
jgi:hypothetical protein